MADDARNAFHRQPRATRVWHVARFSQRGALWRVTSRAESADGSARPFLQCEIVGHVQRAMLGVGMHRTGPLFVLLGMTDAALLGRRKIDLHERSRLALVRIVVFFGTVEDPTFR